MFHVLNSIIQAQLSDPTPAPWRVALSGISGSTSIACWVVILLPQLVEEWRLKSAGGLSIQFISIWFLGDLLNLIGSVWAGLLAQAIVLAVWFCITDALMIGSYFYFTRIYPKHHHHGQHKKSHRPSQTHRVSASEQSPLLNANASDTRRSSRKSRRNSIDSIVLDSTSVFKQYVLPILIVVVAGIAGYFLSSEATHTPEDKTPTGDLAVGPQILGYMSAFLYLTARLPQIYKNYQNKSCEGLSLLFFIFSVFGNFTYALQIFFYRSDWAYIKLYLSWIIGSLGTTVEDFTIFAQFFIYRNHQTVLETDSIIASNNEVFEEP